MDKEKNEEIGSSESEATKNVESTNNHADSDKADSPKNDEKTNLSENNLSSKTDEKGSSKKDDSSNFDEKKNLNNKKEGSKKEVKVEKQAHKSHVLNVVTLTVAIAALGLSIYNYSNSGSVTYNYGNGKDGNSANFESGSIAEIANKVSESVVSITTEVRTESWYGTESSSTAAGTGFILSDNGYIMTNRHVVEGAKNVKVTTNDGTTYSNVEVVGLDPLNDSAILKVENPKDFKAVTLGDSKTINVGQQVIVIGNALGEYSNSVTSGIISGTGRTLVASDTSGSSYERLSDMIQTDAAINGGNSGGPIVNAAGEVIGIATAYASSSQTVGFAIPIGSVKGTIKSVLEDGKYSRAVLGVSYLPVTSEVQSEYKLPVNYGAYLYSENSSSIGKDSAGAEAGLKEKDLIVEVNGIKIGKSGSLSSLLGEYKAGDKVTLKVLRNGKEVNINVTLKAYKSSKSDDD